MDPTSVVAAVIAAASAIIAWRSHEISKSSAADARRSADAAEKSAEAARQSARADAAADHRARTPRITIALESKAGYKQGEVDAIYEIVNEGPEDLDSVIVHRPKTDNSVHYNVAATGRSDYSDTAEVGPLPIASRTRFSLAVGPWVSDGSLPTLRIHLVCTSASGEAWNIPFTLDPPRTRPSRISTPKRIR